MRRLRPFRPSWSRPLVKQRVLVLELTLVNLANLLHHEPSDLVDAA